MQDKAKLSIKYRMTYEGRKGNKMRKMLPNAHIVGLHNQWACYLLILSTHQHNEMENTFFAFKYIVQSDLLVQNNPMSL